MDIRDPIHQFIRLDEAEEKLLDCPAVQRLRHIRQLSMSYLVYPGATHSRFEHSIGTMELAGRAFESILRNSDANVLKLAGLNDDQGQRKARKVLRMASLLHDIGHGPFSHASEDLFPLDSDGNAQKHEAMSIRMIKEMPEISQVLGSLGPRVAYVATGPEFESSVNYRIESPSRVVDRILTAILTGSLGVDRMDYLLRDCHYTGVRYGQFDLARIIETLTLVNDPDTGEPQVALGRGGKHLAEQLLMARWFMFNQVYYQEQRRALDHHLEQFMGEFLKTRDTSGRFPTDLEQYLALTDIEVDAAIRASPEKNAVAIRERRHLRVAKEFSPTAFQSTTDFKRWVTDNIDSSTEIWVDAPLVKVMKSGDASIYVEYPDGAKKIEEVSTVLTKVPDEYLWRVYAAKEDLNRVRQICESRSGSYND